MSHYVARTALIRFKPYNTTLGSPRSVSFFSDSGCRIEEMEVRYLDYNLDKTFPLGDQVGFDSLPRPLTMYVSP